MYTLFLYIIDYFNETKLLEWSGRLVVFWSTAHAEKVLFDIELNFRELQTSY